MKAAQRANCLKCIIPLTLTQHLAFERAAGQRDGGAVGRFDLAKIHSAGWQPQPHPASISPCRKITFLSSSRHALTRALPCSIAVFSLPIVLTDTPPVTSQAPKTVGFIVPSSSHCFANKSRAKKSSGWAKKYAASAVL